MSYLIGSIIGILIVLCVSYKKYLKYLFIRNRVITVFKEVFTNHKIVKSRDGGYYICNIVEDNINLQTYFTIKLSKKSVSVNIIAYDCSKVFMKTMYNETLYLNTSHDIILILHRINSFIIGYKVVVEYYKKHKE